MEEKPNEERLEDNYPVMEFIEDIIYCPSQIYFYFRTGETVKCLYIRQRQEQTTAEIVPCHDNGQFNYNSMWEHLTLKRAYDIEGCRRISEECEEQEIIAIEKELLDQLCQMYPETQFPLHPNRKRRRAAKTLPDILLDDIMPEFHDPKQHVYIFIDDEGDLITDIWTVGVPSVGDRIVLWNNGEFYYYEVTKRLYCVNVQEQSSTWHIYVK